MMNSRHISHITKVEKESLEYWDTPFMNIRGKDILKYSENKKESSNLDNYCPTGFNYFPEYNGGLNK